jgi:predicted Zn-dependent protease
MILARGAACVALACGCAAAGGDAAPEPAYRPTRWDYATFRAAWPDVLDPNYLPFMTHRLPGGPEGDLLFFCRWDDAAMPLAVYVAPPEIPASLQDEFAPRAPQAYVGAVLRALRTWESELDGHVRFRVVEAERHARLVVRAIGAQAPVLDAEHQVLGETPEARHCRVHGRDPDAERLRVGFEVSEARLYLADEHGLLAPDLFEWVALHEIGHALGMRGHSPVPADLMYAVARDRSFGVDSHRVGVPGLSVEDVNSFVSLYEIPNGTIFGRVPVGGREQRLAARPGAPVLSMGPYVDPKQGFEFRPPSGWMRVPTAQGVVVVDGVTWEASPSLQIVVHRYATLEAFLERYGAYFATRGRMTAAEPLEVAGRRAMRLEIEDLEGLAWEEVTLIEAGEGRIFVITGECPPELAGDYRPWFHAALATLEIFGSRAEGRLGP